MTTVAGLDRELRRRVVEAPKSPQALLDVGQQAFRLGRSDPAKWFARSLAIAPDEPGLHFALSVVRPGGAERRRSLRRAIALDPGYGQAWLVLGGESAGTLTMLRRARTADAADAAIGSTLVARLLEAGSTAEALEIAEAICAAEPGHAPGWVNLGRTAVESGAWETGLRCMRRALALAPAMFEGWMNFGSIAGELMFTAGAARSAERAIAINPGHPQARWNRTLSLLTQGEWKRGFADFEARHAVQQTYPHVLVGPPWRGEEGTGSLLVHDEIGYGDVFNFLRYLALARRRVRSLILEVKPGLGRLLGGYPGVDLLLERGAHPPPAYTYDAHVSIETLPGLFGTTAEAIPPPEPRLEPEPGLLSSWGRRLAGVRRPRVGLCWAGNPASAFDRHRSCRLDDLAAVLAVGGVSFVSLQKGAAAADADRRLLSFDGEIADFADTAALIANLDLVITVETSVAHLAGAMQAPSWILLAANPAWRWPRAGDRTGWYPSAELFRASRDTGWREAAAAVASRLRQRFDG